MKQKKLLAVALAAVMSMGLMGCANTQTPGSDNKPTDNNGGDGAKGTIKIGSIMDLSGGMAAAGKATKWGSEYAVKEINDAGGINGHKLEIITYDVKGDPQEAITAYKRLVEQDKVVAVVGPGLSNIGIALSPVAEQMKVPVVAHFMDERATTNEATGKAWGYTYLAEPSCVQQAQAIASYSIEKLGLKKFGVLYDNSNAYSTTHAEPFRDYIKSKGGEVVAFESYGKDTKDYKTQLSKITQASPEAIFHPAYVQQNALAYKQVRQLGYKGTIIGNNTYNPPFPTLVEGTAIEDLYFIYNVDFNGQYAKFLFDAYKAANNNEVPLPNAAFGYDNVKLIANGIKNAEDPTKGESVNKAIESTTKDVMTASGPITISAETHRPVGMGIYIAKYNPDNTTQLLEYYVAK